jgi:ankyrin repeat protein
MALRMLDAGANVNARSLDGKTALMYAARSDSTARVALLLERGADVAAADNDGYNSLMLAASNNHVDTMSLLLLSPGVPVGWVNAQAHDGATALLAASEDGATAAVNALIAAGANVCLAMNSGATTLHLASNADTACLLWSAGARDTLDNDGYNTLVAAVRRNKPDVVEFLLQRGLDVNEMTDDWSPLMRAASHGHVEVIRVLLAAGALVNLQDDDGYTALLTVGQENEAMVVKELLQAGANPRAASNDGETPLMQLQTPEAVKMLVDAAPDLVNQTCNKGRRALAYMTSDETLEELLAACIRHKIQVDVNHRDVNGDTALHIAMLRWGGPAAVELLLYEGADVFGAGYGGTTVLMKPFLTMDHDVMDAEYDFIDAQDDSEDDATADSTIS